MATDDSRVLTHCWYRVPPFSTRCSGIKLYKVSSGARFRRSCQSPHNLFKTLLSLDRVSRSILPNDSALETPLAFLHVCSTCSERTSVCV